MKIEDTKKGCGERQILGVTMKKLFEIEKGKEEYFVRDVIYLILLITATTMCLISLVQGFGKDTLITIAQCGPAICFVTLLFLEVPNFLKKYTLKK